MMNESSEVGCGRFHLHTFFDEKELSLVYVSSLACLLLSRARASSSVSGTLWTLQAYVTLGSAVSQVLGAAQPEHLYASHLACRLSTTRMLLQIIGGPLAAALLSLDGHWGLQGWQWCAHLPGNA